MKTACLAPVPDVLPHRTVPSELALVLLVHLHCASEKALARLTANDSIVPPVRASQRCLLAAHRALRPHQRPTDRLPALWLGRTLQKEGRWAHGRSFVPKRLCEHVCQLKITRICAITSFSAPWSGLSIVTPSLPISITSPPLSRRDSGCAAGSCVRIIKSRG